MLHDLAEIATLRIERFDVSENEARIYLKQLQKTICEKLETSPMRWPISRQESLRQRGLRICFGKNFSPYLAIFKVYPRSRQVIVFHIVWEQSDYAGLMQ
jgi:hypothetical protein